jgi:hypothetical protein
METLVNSELNQHVLASMQKTSHALKGMGLDKSLESVERVMLDLEENHSDVSSMQQTLGMSYGDDESVDWGLELSMLLSDDDCVAPPVLSNAMLDAPEAPPRAAEHDDAQPAAEAPAQEALKKRELAVVDV